MNSGCAPEGIGLSHPADKIAHILTDRRPSWTFTTRLVLPEELESLSMPAHYGIGFDYDQSILPTAPETGEQDPKETVSGAKLRALARTFHDSQLLAKRQVLQSKIEGLFESGKYGREQLL